MRYEFMGLWICIYVYVCIYVSMYTCKQAIERLCVLSERLDLDGMYIATGGSICPDANYENMERKSTSNTCV